MCKKDVHGRYRSTVTYIFYIRQWNLLRDHHPSTIAIRVAGVISAYSNVEIIRRMDFFGHSRVRFCNHAACATHRNL